MFAPPPLFRAARAGSAIGLATIGALIIGFALQLTIAYRFGAGGATDAFFMAQGTSELLTKILLGGSLTSVFLPMFVEHLTQGRPERAWKLANHLFHLAGMGFLLVLGLLALFTHEVVSVIAPGFPPDIRTTTVLLLRIMLPGFFFLLLTDLAIAILHSFRVFGIPALARLVTPLLSLLLVLTAGARYGIVVLAVGTLLGATIQILLMVRALVRSGFVYEPALSLRDPDVRQVMRLVAPFALSVLAAQGAGVVYRILVSHFPEGSLSALKFGEKIVQVSNTLFLGSITTVAFPAFSRAVAKHVWEETRTTMRQALRLMLFFGTPLTVGIILLREPLVRLLYERGSFTAEDTSATASVLALFLVGFVANGVGSLLGHLALALKATRISVAVTIIAQAVSVILFLLLAPRMGIRGLALASAITPYILAALYVLFLTRHLTNLWTVFRDLHLVRFAVAGLALAVGVGSGQRLGGLMSGGTPPDVLILLVSTVLGALAYGAAVWMLRIPEIRVVREIVYYALHTIRR